MIIEQISFYFIAFLLMISMIVNGLLVWLVIGLSGNLDKKHKIINEQNSRLREFQEGVRR